VETRRSSKLKAAKAWLAHITPWHELAGLRVGGYWHTGAALPLSSITNLRARYYVYGLLSWFPGVQNHPTLHSKDIFMVLFIIMLSFGDQSHNKLILHWSHSIKFHHLLLSLSW
jgi:hypothetical protein